MIAPALLLAFALTGGALAGPWLARTQWPARVPWLGIWAWVALAASTVAAGFLAGAALVVPSVHLTPALADFLDACWASVRAHYATPGGAVSGAVGLVVAAGVGARLLGRVLTESLGAAAVRRRHRQSLLLLGHPDLRHGLLVLPCSVPSVYCLPGRPALVVCTSAALDQLGANELQAALAHERAHLRGRHHQLLTLAAALRSAFPFVPTFRLAEENLTMLVEMRADDAARGVWASRDLGTALVKLAGAPAPPIALGASGSGLEARVRRLAVEASGVRTRTAPLVMALGLTLLVTPVLIALGPGAVAMALDYCPPEFLG